METQTKIESLVRDAARYRLLRKMNCNMSAMAVVLHPKDNLRLGAYCPSEELLDAQLDLDLDLSANDTIVSAADLLKDSARLDWLLTYFVSDATNLDDAIIAASEVGVEELKRFIDEAMTGTPVECTTLEVVAMRGDFDGNGYKYIDNGSGSDWQTRYPDWEPVYGKV